MTARAFDVTTASSAEFDAFTAGYEAGLAWGLQEGHRRGYAACDADLAALQRQAMRNVHGAARLPIQTPEVLTLSPDDARQWHAQRRADDAARFRASVRQARDRGAA